VAIKARQYRVMGVPISVVLIEIPPFMLLSTPRAQVRGPENPPGVEWRVPNSGLVIGTASADVSQLPTSWLMAYLVPQELLTVETKPVENFGTRAAIILMHAGAGNTHRFVPPTLATADCRSMNPQKNGWW